MLLEKSVCYKESAYNPGDPGSIPGSGRSAGEGIGYPLQYSWASLGAQLVKNLRKAVQTPAHTISKQGLGREARRGLHRLDPSSLGLVPGSQWGTSQMRGRQSVFRPWWFPLLAGQRVTIPSLTRLAGKPAGKLRSAARCTALSTGTSGVPPAAGRRPASASWTEPWPLPAAWDTGRWVPSPQQKPKSYRVDTGSLGSIG